MRIGQNRCAAYGQFVWYASFKSVVGYITIWLLFILFGLIGSNAQADGFAIKDQSPSGAAKSFAGSASTAEDVSIIFYNPAGMTHLSGSRILFGGSAIAPVTELKSSAGTLPAALGGTSTGGPSTDSDVSSDAFVPVLYGMWDVSSGLKVGFGLNSPFGLSSRFDATWQGRFHAVTSKLKTINFNPSVAYRLTDQISIGAGLQVAYANSRLANAVATTTGEGFIDVDGDDFGIGWTFGVLVEPWLGTRFGISYRSNIDHQLDGSGTVTPGIGGPVSVNVMANLNLPETIRLGLSQDIGKVLSLHLGAAWRRWSRVEERRVNFDAPVAILGGATSLAVNNDWKNAWFLSAGATYRPSAKWILRTGIAYDNSPVPDVTRGPAIPLGDALSLTFGATYSVSKYLDVTFSYAHIFQEDTTVSLASAGTGSLSAEFEGRTDVVSLHGSLRF